MESSPEAGMLLAETVLSNHSSSSGSTESSCVSSSSSPPSLGNKTSSCGSGKSKRYRRPDNLSPLSPIACSFTRAASRSTSPTARARSPRRRDSRARLPSRERAGSLYSDANGQIRIRSPRGHVVVPGSKHWTGPARQASNSDSDHANSLTGDRERPMLQQLGSSNSKRSSSRSPSPSQSKTSRRGNLSRALSLGETEGFIQKLSSNIEVEPTKSAENTRAVGLAICVDDQSMQSHMMKFESETLSSTPPRGRLRRYQSMVEGDLATAASHFPRLGGSLKWNGMAAGVATGARHSELNTAGVTRRSQRRTTIVTRQPRRSKSREMVSAHATDSSTHSTASIDGSCRPTRRDGRGSWPDVDSSAMQAAASAKQQSDDLQRMVLDAAGADEAGGGKMKRQVIYMSLWGEDVVDRALILFCILAVLVTSIGILLLEPPKPLAMRLPLVVSER